MKQRGKRNNSKLVHVSFDEVEKFIPRIPKQICPNEDNITPRICAAPNVLSAIQAMPQGGTVVYNMARIGVPVVIHAYYIESDAILMPEQIADKVPDAVATGEMWVMAVPTAVCRIDYKIIDPYVPMRIDRNGTRERFLVWYPVVDVSSTIVKEIVAPLVVYLGTNTIMNIFEKNKLSFSVPINSTVISKDGTTHKASDDEAVG